MAVEIDVTNTRTIVLASAITVIVTVISVWLVAGWFDRNEQDQVIRTSNYEQSVARQLEKKQKESLTTESGGVEWMDKQAGIARLPLDAAMDLAVKTEKERRKN
ncbi:MAG: hypothetical protein V3W41_05690 [Planctomycetota bacterium]